MPHPTSFLHIIPSPPPLFSHTSFQIHWFFFLAPGECHLCSLGSVAISCLILPLYSSNPQSYMGIYMLFWLLHLDYSLLVHACIPDISFEASPSSFRIFKVSWGCGFIVLFPEPSIVYTLYIAIAQQTETSVDFVPMGLRRPSVGCGHRVPQQGNRRKACLGIQISLDGWFVPWWVLSVGSSLTHF